MWRLGNVEIAYAVTTAVENGTALTYSANVTDNGTFEMEVFVRERTGDIF